MGADVHDGWPLTLSAAQSFFFGGLMLRSSDLRRLRKPPCDYQGARIGPRFVQRRRTARTIHAAKVMHQHHAEDHDERGDDGILQRERAEPDDEDVLRRG